MRWSNLTLEAEEQRRLPGYRDPAPVRRFDAPEALDVRFYEVQAKSVLNRVPERSRMPFRWTINPYRGCTHACTYCASGDTRILMADGSTKPLADLLVGDSIYGTAAADGERRLTPTRVEAHWSSQKRAYRIALENGTELVASGDHRFLSSAGWRHVLAGEGLDLGVDSQLLALGRDAAVEPGAPLMARVRVVSIEPLSAPGELFDITTGTGDFIANGVVSHNCFARPTHTYLDFDAGRDFEREIVVKVNAPEVLGRELARPSWKREHVALGTNTDPYQWVESRYRLMEGIWETLRDAANPCSVLTKSPLLLRDIELMKQLNAVTSFSACLSIPTLDEKAWRETEPHTPSPRARLEAVAELNRAGIRTGVLIAPLMPGINDAPAQLEPLLEAAHAAGAESIGGVALHLRGEVRQVFMGWLEDARPELVGRYKQLYRRGAYAPQEERRRLARMVRQGRGPNEFGSLRGTEGSEEEASEDLGHDPPPRPSMQTSLF